MILGPEFYFFAVLLVVYILREVNFVMRSSSCTMGCSKLSRKFDKAVSPIFSSNGMVRIGLQTYTLTGFATYLNLKRMVINTASDALSVGVAILCLLNFILFPIFVIGVLISKQ